MRSTRILTALVAVVLVSWAGAIASPPPPGLPGNMILQVPDWNQPPSHGAAGYPGWCSPTAGGNIMGYWEDVMGCAGLTDGLAYNQTVVYPNTAGTWQQGLYIDGIVEMGWFMNTGNWQVPNPGPFPPNAGSTNLGAIGPGLLAYATSSWTDNSYPQPNPVPGTGIVKKAYPNTQVGMDPVMNAQTWLNYVTEIDSGRPVEVTFDHWVNPQVFLGTVTLQNFPNQMLEKYPWDMSVDPHSVVGVGYIDITPGFQNNGADEWFICQDGWPGPGMGGGGTGQYVAVPLDSWWTQNDYVYVVPEPMSIGLFALCALALVRRRRA